MCALMNKTGHLNKKIKFSKSHFEEGMVKIVDKG